MVFLYDYLGQSKHLTEDALVKLEHEIPWQKWRFKMKIVLIIKKMSTALRKSVLK